MTIDPKIIEQLLAQRDALSAQLFAAWMSQGSDEYLRAFLTDGASSKILPTWSREDADHYAQRIAQAADAAASAWYCERVARYAEDR